jgi:hypothetical protein
MERDIVDRHKAINVLAERLPLVRRQPFSYGCRHPLKSF